MFRSFSRALLLPLLLLLGAAWADDPVALELESLLVTVETTDDGPVERFAPALEVAPGDRIEWRLVAVNTTDAPLPGVALTLPLSGRVTYLPGSARAGLGPDAAPLDAGPEGDGTGLVARFSADGGASFHAPPLLRTVTEVRGGEEVTVQRPIEPYEYTHAQVVLTELEPGQPFTFVVRTEVR